MYCALKVKLNLGFNWYPGFIQQTKTASHIFCTEFSPHVGIKRDVFEVEIEESDHQDTEHRLHKPGVLGSVPSDCFSFAFLYFCFKNI